MNNQNNTSKKEKQGLKSFLKARGTRRGTVSIIVTVLFIAAVVLLNIVMSAVTDRLPLYLDVTSNSAYKLQDETGDYLSGISKPVTIYVLQKETDFESGDSTNYKYYVQANKLIHAIEDGSDNIDLHYIDLTSTPTFTSDYPQVDWTKSHIALVVCGDAYRAVDLTDMFTYDEQQYYYYGTYVITAQKVEQSILTAITNVTTDEKTKVAVLSGQGEQDMTAFSTLLENNAYEIENLSLLNSQLSEDTEFVVIYDPDVDIDADIYTKLSDWLNNGGKFGHHLVYFPNDRNAVSDYPNLNALLTEYGMEMNSGYIYENSGDYLIPGYNHYISIFDYSDDTTYTDGLRNPSIPVVMSLTMPISITDETLATPLLQSSDKSFLSPFNLSEEDQESFDPQTGILYGAAIGKRNDGTEDGQSSTLTVIGSYDSVTPNYLSINSYNNSAYFVNLFNTLSDREDASVIIEGKNPNSAELGLTSADQIVFPSILVRFVIPTAVLLIGLFIWIRRRHR